MPAFPRARRRRPARGGRTPPVATRPLRLSLAVALLALLLASFASSRPETLPPAPPPAFDGASALSTARQLATEFPDRSPGSLGAHAATEWVAARFAALGYPVRRDRFRATAPGFGPVPLENLTAIARGRSGRAILVVAARDNVGRGPGANLNASGTGALLELARLYGGARAEGGGVLTPTHTLLFVSADGGAYGNLGAARVASRPGMAERTLAVVNLAAIAGQQRPRIDFAGAGPDSPTPTLVATGFARMREEAGRPPRHTGIAGQLLDLAFPFTFYDHGPFAERSIPAVTLTTAGVRPPEPFGDGPERLSSLRMAQLGSSAQALVDSLDGGGLELAPGPRSYLFLGRRIVPGWAVAGAILAFLLPFGVGLAQHLRHCRRLGARLGPAVRSQVRRLGFWLFVGATFWLFTLVGSWAEGSARPLSPYAPGTGDWPVLGLGAFLLLTLAGWVIARSRLAGRGVDPAGELAGFTAALLLLAAVALVTALANPYALIYVLPSLYAWSVLPRLRTRRGGLRLTVYVAGLVGPLVLVANMALRFELGLDAPWYLAQLAALGTIPPGAVAVALAWAAAAAQLAAVTAGRYVPYPNRTARRRVGLTATARRLHAATPSRTMGGR